MKKIILYTILGAGLAMPLSSCSDFLEVSSPSEVDADFVYKDISTAEAAIAGINEAWRVATANSTFGNGLYYAVDAPGSDIERHPEAYTGQLGRHYPEGLYEDGAAISSWAATNTIDFKDSKNAFTYIYATIALANNAISAIEARADYEEIINSKLPSTWGFFYGQAVAARAASYLDLVRYYGDVPYLTYGGQNATVITGRDEILEGEIAKLRLVEPLMYRPGETDGQGNIVGKGTFSRTLVQGLIGRFCVYAGGYSTRRSDMEYKSLAGNTLSFEKIGTENNGAFYGRRTDWQDFFSIAKEYLDAAVSNPGSTVVFHSTDPRGTVADDGRHFGNPYQYFFQQLMEYVAESQYADESIYEIPMTRGNSNERPYSQGRVSDGGGSNAYPCKGYGQCRIQPTYYYGWFDNNDMRRDVTITVTGSTGKGVEKLIPFTMGSKSSAGGLCMNKFDENRQPDPYYQKQRNSGINGPYMRLSHLYLLDAEVNAVLNNEGVAKDLLKKVRERAFATPALADVDGFIQREGGLYNAIIKERAFEFGGEGDRRNVLIRTGKLPEAIKETKEQLIAMVNGLKANGSYTFDNGNTISNYIWTVSGDLKEKYGYRLTTQCVSEKDPFLFPGWRGQFDDWGSKGAKESDYKGKSNLAIKGLFEQYTPNAIEVTYAADGTKETMIGKSFKEMMDLMGQVGSDGKPRVSSIVEKDDDLGFALTKWAIDIVNNEAEYTTNVFKDYSYSKAPIYLYPIPSNTIRLSLGGITNGFGFPQE